MSNGMTAAQIQMCICGLGVLLHSALALYGLSLDAAIGVGVNVVFALGWLLAFIAVAVGERK